MRILNEVGVYTCGGKISFVPALHEETALILEILNVDY
jgi:hypothetical protein